MRRRAEAFLAAQTEAARATAVELVTGLDDEVVAAHARLAWACNATAAGGAGAGGGGGGGGLRVAVVRRADAGVTLGVDVVQPPQITLESHGVMLTVSEGYLRVNGVRVRACRRACVCSRECVSA
jgi:hypothetical protein